MPRNINRKPRPNRRQRRNMRKSRMPAVYIPHTMNSRMVKKEVHTYLQRATYLVTFPAGGGVYATSFYCQPTTQIPYWASFGIYRSYRVNYIEVEYQPYYNVSNINVAALNYGFCPFDLAYDPTTSNTPPITANQVREYNNWFKKPMNQAWKIKFRPQFSNDVYLPGGGSAAQNNQLQPSHKNWLDYSAGAVIHGNMLCALSNPNGFTTASTIGTFYVTQCLSFKDCAL